VIEKKENRRLQTYHQQTLEENDFIKTTYDISLDSLISLFSRGFSPLRFGNERNERKITVKNEEPMVCDPIFC